MTTSISTIHDHALSTSVPTATEIAEGSGGITAEPATQRKRYLTGFMSQSEAASVLAVELGENVDLPRLRDIWLSRVAAAHRVRETPVILDDRAVEEVVRPIPAEHAGICDEALREIAGRRQLRGSTFGFALVRIDDLIVLQGSVTLERAEQVAAGLPAHPSFEDLLRLSVGAGRPPPAITHRWIGNTTLLFTSADHDVRPLNPEIRLVARIEGNAADTPALVMPIGAGDPAIYCVRTFTVLPDGERVWYLTLQNGVHRLFALRERGVRYVPILVVDPRTSEETKLLLRNWSTERQQQGVSRRPPLLRDFFDDSLTTTLEIPRTKMCVRVELKVEKFPA